MKKILLSAVLLLWLSNNAATLGSDPRTISPQPDTAHLSEEGCYLEPPTGLTLTNLTPISATLTWNPVQGAAYFRVQMFKKVNNVIAANILVDAKPSNNTITVMNLAAGVEYYFQVFSVCANGQTSL